MKKLNKLIALLTSLSTLSLTSVSAFSINAEEIPEPAYYSESEAVFTTTTATTDSLPTVLGIESYFSDGAYLYFQGSSVKDFDSCCIEFTDLPENFEEASGYIIFAVVVNDTVYDVKFPYNLYNDVLYINFDESCYNMLAYVAWDESYFAHVSEMDSELASEIYEEFRKCTYAILEVDFIKETEATVTTTATSLPEYTNTDTYTYTTLPEFVTTNAPVTTTTYTETIRNTGTDNDVPILYGDANTDGCIDIADVVAVSAYVADSETNYLDGYGMLCGDVHNTGDGITANDALAIQKFLAGDSADFC